MPRLSIIGSLQILVVGQIRGPDLPAEIRRLTTLHRHNMTLQAKRHIHRVVGKPMRLFMSWMFVNCT